jgi:probable HAF family extracellular repeat protein
MIMKTTFLKQFRWPMLILAVCATETWCHSATPLHRRQFAVIDIAESTGGNFGTASAVNNAGQVVGVANTEADSYPAGFIYDQAGGFRFLPVPFTPSAINEQGDVVGIIGVNGEPHAALWTADGRLVDLHPGPEWTASEAVAINDRGQVAGNIRGSSGGFVYDPDIGFVINYNPGPFVDLNNRGEVLAGVQVYIYEGGEFFRGPRLQFNFREVRAISDASLVVGTIINPDGSGRRAFSWNSRGRHGPTDLGTLPSGLQSAAYAVNRHGQIVGWSSIDGADTPRAVLWEHGDSYDLNNSLPADSGWNSLRFALGINDNGFIVGIGGRPHRQAPFLLVPLPQK